MARPQKVGLDYFPLDVDIDQDDKVAIIETQHGIKGFGIVIKLLMHIYKNSYYYEWTEKEQILFSRRVNVDINEVNEIIKDCIKWGLFDEELFKTFEILTSRGIQKRYFEIAKRRQRVEVVKEFVLLDNASLNAYSNLVIVNINGDNVDINPQRKVKKSKVKESKAAVVNEQAATALYDDGFKSIIKAFGENIHPPSPIEAERLESWLDDMDADVIIAAIEEAIVYNKRSMKYIEGILRNWHSNNIRTKLDLEAYRRDWEDRKQSEGQASRDLNKTVDFARFEHHEYTDEQLESLFEEIG